MLKTPVYRIERKKKMRKKFPRSQFSADVLWELLRFADAFLGQKTSGGGGELKY